MWFVKAICNTTQFGDLASFWISRLWRASLASTLRPYARLPRDLVHPKNVGLHTNPPVGLVGTNSTTLSWDQGTDLSLAGYEVVWRNMDDSDWTQVIPVGNVTTVSFPFFPKDNFIMAVRAVDVNGLCFANIQSGS
jgi:hypothetical protein